MSSEFQKSTLGKLITFANGKSSPERCDNGRFPVFGSNGLIGRANETNSPSNSIVVGRVGSYCGSVHFSGKPCWVTDNAIRATAKDDNDPSFLFYLLKQLNLNNWRSGSGQPLINQTTLNSIEVCVPPPPSQKAIGEFIGALDDRIALLRETNATLEAIAQAMFKSWFVDFDPVHAKQQGRAPEGMSETTAALFPDSFEESELGLVSKGWKVGTLANIASVKGGFAYKGDAFGRTGSPVIKIKNIVGDGTVDLQDAQYIASDIAEKTKRFALTDGDIVIAMTGATIGKTGVVVTDGIHVPYLNQRVAKFEPNLTGEDNRWLVFTAFQNNFISDQVVNAASGSAQPNISTSGIESVRLVIPSDNKLLDLFSNTVSPLFQSWISNQRQAQTLATLRDTLLPRLISGQLRLPEAEAALEEVAT